jgi:hypothetical protein
MKKLLIFSLLLCLGLRNGQAQITKAERQAAVHQIIFQQQNDWNKGNLEGFMQGYWVSDSLMFVSKKGITYGWKGVLDNYKKSYSDKGKMGKLTFVLRRTDEIDPQNILVTGHWKVEADGKVQEGLFTLWFRFFETVGWKIRADHTS